jgi:hypothetical protein
MMPRTFLKLLFIICIAPGIVCLGAYASEVRVLLYAGIKPGQASVAAAVRLFDDLRRTWKIDGDLDGEPGGDESRSAVIGR